MTLIENQHIIFSLFEDIGVSIIYSRNKLCDSIHITLLFMSIHIFLDSFDKRSKIAALSALEAYLEMHKEVKKLGLKTKDIEEIVSINKEYDIKKED